MLTRRELSDMFVSSFRSIRRRNEVAVVNDLVMVDELFTILRENNIVLTDAQWSEMDAATQALTLGGQNMVHQERIDTAEQEMRASGMHPALIDWVLSYMGRIFFYVGENVEGLLAASTDWSDARIVRSIGRIVFFTMAHERRHTYQDARALVEECRQAQDPAHLMQIHDDLPCEQDADNWASAQLTYVYGM